MYLSLVTDTTTSGTDSGVSWWSLLKDAVVSFNIVAWLNSPITTDTDLLFDIIDELNEQIVDEGCQKIADWDGVDVRKVTEASVTPIVYNTKNRAVVVKQYLFTYYAK
jgi:hypothetical protein